MVPQTVPPSLGAQQNRQFAARCVVGFTDGCPNSGPEQWSSRGGSLQVVGCSLFNRDICGARLPHEARGGRVWGPPYYHGARRTTGEQRDTRYPGDQANGYFL